MKKIITVGLYGFFTLVLITLIIFAYIKASDALKAFTLAEEQKIIIEELRTEIEKQRKESERSVELAMEQRRIIKELHLKLENCQGR
ncbi:MAG: hypothetical protein GDA51_10890 [Ekhidna sp.]|nr:hypothetical protein [Ekhidna sp.]MBC6409656.1 hypothetical protein [Ekhidna sp.]MBC6426946.1 hypothetical protein [Ekhidna sp.]